MIDIGSVLKRIDDTVDERTLRVKEYGLRFITADGRLRTIIGRKNVKGLKQKADTSKNPRGKFRYNLKRNNTLLFHDDAIDRPTTIKVACITHFKGFEENTWQKVFH